MKFDFFKKKKRTVVKQKKAPPAKFEPKPYMPPPMPKISGFSDVKLVKIEPGGPSKKKHDTTEPLSVAGYVKIGDSLLLNPKKEFLQIFKQLTYRHSPWNVWSDFVFMFACALSNAVDKSHYDEREAQYMTTIKKYNKTDTLRLATLAVAVASC